MLLSSASRLSPASKSAIIGAWHGQRLGRGANLFSPPNLRRKFAANSEIERTGKTAVEPRFARGAYAERGDFLTGFAVGAEAPGARTGIPWGRVAGGQASGEGVVGGAGVEKAEEQSSLHEHGRCGPAIRSSRIRDSRRIDAPALCPAGADRYLSEFQFRWNRKAQNVVILVTALRLGSGAICRTSSSSRSLSRRRPADRMWNSDQEFAHA